MQNTNRENKGHLKILHSMLLQTAYMKLPLTLEKKTKYKK